MITAYADSRPIVLWGSWLGSEVIIGVDPLVELSGLDAADCWAPLRTWPQLAGSGPDTVGGGWFAVLVLVGREEQGWSGGQTLLALVLSAVPLGGFYVERQMVRVPGRDAPAPA